MSQDELSRIWAWRLQVLMRRVTGLERRMQCVELRFAAEPTPQTPSSPISSSTPTASPSPIRSALSRAAEKMGREALTQFAMWLAAKIAMWVLPWLVAWWTMGGAFLRFLERWAPFLLG
jgi:hypothetical protein